MTVDDEGPSVAVPMDICLPKFLQLRQMLMEVGRLSSRWIREEFLDQPGVYYASNRERLEEIFLAWLHLLLRARF